MSGGGEIKPGKTNRAAIRQPHAVNSLNRTSRLLSDCRAGAFKLGLCLSFQRLDGQPVEANDARVGALITD
ncbi:MAG: hypothetical protein ABI871_01855 [Chthoniobacterales bacterium]